MRRTTRLRDYVSPRVSRLLFHAKIEFDSGIIPSSPRIAAKLYARRGPCGFAPFEYNRRELIRTALYGARRSSSSRHPFRLHRSSASAMINLTHKSRTSLREEANPERALNAYRQAARGKSIAYPHNLSNHRLRHSDDLD